MTTRGVRNNNPGNIDRTATKWQGMAADQSGDKRFVVFTSPQFGIRALAKTLITYQVTHKIRTVRKVINRWAPPVENDTDAYIEAVAKKIGVDPDEVIDLDSHAVMAPLVKAIIAHENAGYRYPDRVVDEALVMAGVFDARPTPLLQLRRVQGIMAAGVTSLAGAALDPVMLKTAQTTLQPVVEISPILKAVFVAITLLILTGVVFGFGVKRQQTGA